MNIIINKSASERLAGQTHVASPQQLEKIQEQIREHEEILKNRGLIRPDDHVMAGDFNTKALSDEIACYRDWETGKS